MDNYVAHMFYAYPFSHNIVVTIVYKGGEFYLLLYTYTIVFSWYVVYSKKLKYT